MTEKQDQILKLLWNYESLKIDQVLKICNCTETDINLLIAKKAIVREKDSKILRYSNKKIQPRVIAAFDVVIEYLDRKPVISRGTNPVVITMKTKECSYDIIALKEIEVDTLFENDIDKLTKSDRLIIIIETKQYIKKLIKTNKPCLVCKYSPLEIVDRIN